MKKVILLFVIVLTLGGCAENARRDIACTPDIMMSALPQKCGAYDMEYGTISPKGFLVRFKNKEVVYLLGGFTPDGVVGRDVVMAGKYWPQYIGGVLREDGGSNESYIVHNLEKARLVQLYEDNSLNRCKLFRWCQSVKSKK